MKLIKKFPRNIAKSVAFGNAVKKLTVRLRVRGCVLRNKIEAAKISRDITKPPTKKWTGSYRIFLKII